MRLLIATPLYPPEAGGPASYSYALEQGLPSRGIEIVLVPFSLVRHLPKGIKHIAYAYHLIRAGLRCNAILALDPVSVGLPAWVASFILRKPFFVKIVGDYAWEQGRQRHRMWMPLDEFVRTTQIPFPTYLLRKVQMFVARRAKQIIVPSEYLKTILLTWGLAGERIHVIHNAVPVRAPGKLTPQITESTLPRIITAGRLVPWKGINGLITAMVEVRKAIPSATLIVVGDGPEKETLEKYALARLPQEAVIFTGVQEPDAALASYAAADVFVLNSSYEGLSHILIEAMELARPIVATRAGGNTELIEDGKTGLLVSVGDSEKLAESIIDLCTNRAKAESLGAQARERSHDFSQEKMLDTTARFFKGDTSTGTVVEKDPLAF
jgi:glycosyltransferase involved in cell wall biosynthesis